MTTLKLNPFFAAASSTPRVVVASAPRPHGTWIERLADWADRQPQHHRLGRWTMAGSAGRSGSLVEFGPRSL